MGRGYDEEDGEEDEDELERVEALPFPVKRKRGNLLDEARRHYQEGRYGEAVKYLFSYQLVQLDKHQLIRLAPGKTNRQYLRELAGPNGLGELLERTMVVFEDFFFGNRTIGRDRFESCWSHLGRFEALLGEGTP
jgi:hypothetical protein